MRKKYLKLTEEQKKRGVIFSSQLIPSGMVHEVMENDKDKDERINRLLKDSFFNNSSFKYNEIRS